MAFRLTKIDQILADDGVYLELAGGRERQRGIVKFQFPPVLESDSKSVKYDEKSFKFIEPVAIFSGANAREISLKWNYVITGIRGDGWTIDKISEQVKLVRGYFYASIQTQTAADSALIINFKAYNEVGPGTGETFSFRGDGVDIRFKGPIISEGAENEIGKTWPLVTELSMKLKPWTQGETNEDEEPSTNLPGLQKATRLLGNPGWY